MKRFGFVPLMSVRCRSRMNILVTMALIGGCLCATPSAWATGVWDQQQTAENGNYQLWGSNEKRAQSFKPGFTYGKSSPYMVSLKVAKVGSPGTLNVQIRSDNGSGVPGSTILASATKSASAVTTTPTWYEFYVADSSSPALQRGVTYWIVVYNSSTGDSSNYYTIQKYDDNTTDKYSYGQAARYQDSTGWTIPLSKADVTFKSWAAPSFSFIHISDTHVADKNYATPLRTDYDVDGAAFGQMTSFISGMSNKPAFVVDSGDVVDWGAYGTLFNPNFQKLLGFLSPWDKTAKRYYIDKTAQTIPIYFSLGNHDTRDRSQMDSREASDFHSWLLHDDPAYLEHDNIADYHFVQCHALIIVMDSGRDTFRYSWENPLENPEGNGLTTSQMTWLKNTIQNNASRFPKILVMHHPPANGLGELCNASDYCGPVVDGGDGSFVDNRDDFFKVMAGTIGGRTEASWKVDVVFTGHVHQSLIADASGNPYSFASGTHTPTDPTWYVQTGAAYTGVYRAIAIDGSDITVGAATLASGVGSCAASPTYAIAGRIEIDGTTAGLAGVTVTLNTGASETTDSDGFFSINGLAQGTYTVTPALAGYTFSPASAQGEVCNMDVAANFTASCVPLATPETPNFPMIGSTTLTVSWSAVTGATSYDVYRTLEGTPICEWAYKLDTVSGGLTTYSDSGLTRGTEYLYSIVAKSVCGSSLPGPCGSVRTLSESPTITTQPANQTVMAGSPATFSVAASGTPPLTYQWYRDGKAISAATSASYTIAATTTAENGASFNATITNTAGTTTSNAAVLTVSDADLSIAWNSGGSITLLWSGNAASYDVYSTTDYAAGFSNDPLAIVTGTTWTDLDAATYPQRYYRVAPHGGSSVSRAVGKFDLTLLSGMNLVSMPLIADDNSIRSVMHQDASYYPVLEIWDRKDDGVYRKAIFNLQNPPHYWDSGSDPFTTLSVDKGYWFKTSADAIFTLVGAVPVKTRTVTLGDGMHIVGWASVKFTKFLDAIPQTPEDFHVIEVFERQPSGRYSDAYYLYDYPPDYWWSADSSFQGLTPGKGYWFKVRGSYTWQYNP